MAFNITLAIIDLGNLLLVSRQRVFSRAVIGLLVLGLVALLLGFYLAHDIFHYLKHLSDAVFIHGVFLLAGFAWMFWGQARKLALVFACSAILLIGIAIDAFFIEPTWLNVSRYHIQSDKLDRSLKIVVLADIQTDNVGAYERMVLQQAMAESPDLILMPGDYIHVADLEVWRELAGQLRGEIQDAGLDAPLGVYAVGGNVDPPETTELFAGTNVTWMGLTQSAPLSDITITGLDLTDSRNRNFEVPPADSFHIVFGHYPDFALGKIEADLLVAGHTHGGQVQLPFIGPLIVLSDVPRQWGGGGLTSLEGGRWLVVSKGIGMERLRAPRLRFLCRPEIVVVQIN